MDGFLNILKPPGISSGSVVGYVRHRLPRGTAVGHGGTLDPEAAGVLPLCVGRATRLFDYIIDKERNISPRCAWGSRPTRRTQPARSSRARSAWR